MKTMDKKSNIRSRIIRHGFHSIARSSVAGIQRKQIGQILRSNTIQAELTVGQPNDQYDQEAGRVADEVMRMPEPNVQRQAGAEKEEEEESVQTKPELEGVQRQAEEDENDEETMRAKSNDDQTPGVSQNLEDRIQSLKGRGMPLPSSERKFFEPRLGVHLGVVRVHTDANAAEIARSINARAFTRGRNVVFGAGQYSPGTGSGRQLLAHELTHVVQQNAGGGIKLKSSTISNSTKHGIISSLNHGLTAQCIGAVIQCELGRAPLLPSNCVGTTNITNRVRQFVAQVPAILAALPRVVAARRNEMLRIARHVFAPEGAFNFAAYNFSRCSKINLPGLGFKHYDGYVDINTQTVFITQRLANDMDAFLINRDLKVLLRVLKFLGHEKRHVTIGTAARVRTTGMKPSVGSSAIGTTSYLIEEILTRAEEIAIERRFQGSAWRVPSNQTLFQRLWNTAKSRVTPAELRRLRNVIITQLQTRYGNRAGCANSITVGVLSAMEHGSWYICASGKVVKPPAGLSICSSGGRHRVCS